MRLSYVDVLISVRPMIDKGAAGSKSVRVHRSAIWQIKVKGEPPPEFSWFKGGQRLHNSDEFVIATDEYQGGATATLKILRSQVITKFYRVFEKKRNEKLLHPYIMIENFFNLN